MLISQLGYLNHLFLAADWVMSFDPLTNPDIILTLMLRCNGVLYRIDYLWRSVSYLIYLI